MNRLLPLLIPFFAVSCAAFSTTNVKEVGKNGWALKRLTPGRIIHVERPGAEVEIGPHEGDTYFIRYHRPGSDVRLPVYPNAHEIDVQPRPIWVNLIYSIPEGETFRDVYRWYVDWFDFQRVD